VAAVNDDHFRGARQLLIKHGAAEACRLGTHADARWFQNPGTPY
jgi:hypothetical protein